MSFANAIKQTVSEAEWEARVNVAALYRWR